MNTVLVVDDSLMMRQMLTELLRDSGIEVIAAVNGREAVNHIKSRPPDLVITDIVMPEMNGYELCRWIKNDPIRQKIPVLMCTTKSEEFDRYWGMKQGADAYITKPFNPLEMMKTVMLLLKAN